jgi:hypothetical protein
VVETGSPAVSVERLMRELEDSVRADLRARIVERGGPAEYQDEELFGHVERLLRRALEGRDHDTALVAGLLGDSEDWQLRTRLRFSSHRPIAGAWIVAIKRRLLLPLTRWLYEYSLENFTRQQRLNRIIFACLEELAIENARLRRELQRLGDVPR